MSMTQYIFNNSKFRSHLVESLLNGNLKIDKCNYAVTLINLGYPTKNIKQGDYGFSAEICQTLNYSIKVIPFEIQKMYGNIENPNRPENLEVSLLQLINKKILLTKISPHIALYIQDFKCHGLPILWQHYKNQYSDDLIGKNYFDHSAIVLISEMAQLGSLDSFIMKNKKIITNETLSIYFFQFLYTLAQIQKNISGFRHNDCQLDNILVQTDGNYQSSDRRRFYIYFYEGHYYKIPIIEGQLKLWDFGSSNIYGQTENLIGKRPASKNFGYRYTKNDYYDLHTFVNNFLMLMNSINDSDHLSNLVELFERIVPPQFYGHFRKNAIVRGQLVPDIQYLTPAEVLSKDPYIINNYEITLDQLGDETEYLVDSHGIDLTILKDLIGIASKNTKKIVDD